MIRQHAISEWGLEEVQEKITKVGNHFFADKVLRPGLKIGKTLMIPDLSGRINQ